MELERRSSRKVVLQGIAGGVAGGLAFAVVEMLLSLAAGDSAARPFRAIASIVLGPAAVSPDYSLGTALLVGAGFHLLLSAVYGVVFVGLLAAFRQLESVTSVVIAEAVIYAMALWVINFLIIAPALFSQLGAVSSFWLSFTVAHGFYGLVLGGYLLGSSAREAAHGVR